MKNNFFILLVVSSITACTVLQNKDIKYKTAHKFIELVKANDIYGIRSMLREGDQRNDTQELKFYVNRTKELFDKYGVPPEKEWKITYDTLPTLYKTESIIITIVKKPKQEGDKDGFVRGTTLKLDFDFTHKYIPDRVLAGYTLNTFF